MELSIIITSYKNPELLKVCIDSIKKNITLTDYEMIEIDCESEEATQLMMREDYPEIKFYAFKENVGYQALLKKGFEMAEGKYILIMNGDAVVKKGSIEKLLEYVRSNKQVGLVGPQLLGFNEELQYSCFRFYTPMTIVYRRTFLGRLKFAQKKLDLFLMKDFDHKSEKEVDWLMGSALMTSREVIKKVGLMDPRFKMYFEDVDWCRRFWEAGYKVIYYPSSRMYHYHGKGSSGKSIIKTLIFNRLAWLHIISAVKYFLKYWGKPLPQHN
ncbi:MAG: glycosyltransferase family 2 protein [Parcubacteria group bacterium]|jgi:hypothetical protein